MPVLDIAQQAGDSQPPLEAERSRARPVYRVFVSSTWLDLQPERRALMYALNRMEEMRFVGMEFFGNRPDDTHDASLDQVDRCDLFVGIIGHRYGSGITEAEYRRARSRGLPCFIYFKSEATARPELLDDDAALAEKLRRLKEDLLANHTVKDFAVPEELAANATADLHNWVAARWISIERASAPAPRILPAATTPDRVNILRLLERIEQDWIKGVLEASLHHRAWLELGLDWRDDAVEHPWDRIVVAPDRPIQTLSASDTITGVFDAAQHTLLILGEPGAGKTTTVLELARDLIARSREAPHEPAPVVLALSTWRRAHRDFSAWVVQELGLRYQVPKRLARTWLEQARLALILDGLDEVPADHRPACVEAINAFEQAHHPPGLVVTCRVAEYEELAVKLRLRAAICLQPLSTEQIERYFNAAGERLAPLRAALREDAGLRELARSPLMLSVMTMAWRDASPVAAGAGPIDERRRQLFEAYAQAALRRRGKAAAGYSAEQTLRWLGWLAGRMKAHGHTLFAIEQLQPGWLDGAWRQFGYFVITRLLGALGIAVPFLFFGPTLGRNLLLGAAVVIGLYLALVDFALFNFEWRSSRRASVRFWLVLGGFIAVGWLCLASGSDAETYLLMAALALCTPVDVRGLDIKPAGSMEWSWRLALQRGLSSLIVINAVTSIVFLVGFVEAVARSNWQEGFKLFGPWYVPALAIAAVMVASVWWRLRPARSWRNVALALTAVMLGGQVGASISTLSPWSGDWTLLWAELTVAIVCGVFAGFASIMIDPARPQQRGALFWLRAPLQSASLVALALFFPATIAVYMAWLENSAASLTQHPLIPIWLISGAGGLVAFLRFGGFNGLQHSLLRWQLVRTGVLPRDPDRFFNHAAQLALLQKVGLGYRFVHALLLDHLASGRDGTRPVATPVNDAALAAPAASARPVALRIAVYAAFLAALACVVIGAAALYVLWRNARGGTTDASVFVGAVVLSLVMLVPTLMLGAQQMRRLPLRWLALAAGVIGAGLVGLAIDDAALRRPIPPPARSAEGEKSFAVLMRYGFRHPAGREFRPGFVLRLDPRQATAWREGLLKHRARIEESWARVEPLHAWASELAQFERIADYSGSRRDAERLGFAPRNAYMEYISAFASLRAIDGHGDDALELLLPLLQAGRKLQAAAGSMIHYNCGMAWQVRALRTARFILDTTAVSRPTRAKFAAVLSDDFGAADGARQVYALRYKELVENSDSLGEIVHFYDRNNRMRRALNIVSPVAFNRRATLNRCAELFAELETFAAQQEFAKIEPAVTAFLAREGTLRLENAGGAWVVRQLCDELGAGAAQWYWSLEVLRTSVRDRLQAES